MRCFFINKLIKLFLPYFLLLLLIGIAYIAYKTGGENEKAEGTKKKHKKKNNDGV
jgi:hypothetical protein